jgi:hypothetical protein
MVKKSKISLHHRLGYLQKPHHFTNIGIKTFYHTLYQIKCIFIFIMHYKYQLVFRNTSELVKSICMFFFRKIDFINAFGSFADRNTIITTSKNGKQV